MGEVRLSVEQALAIAAWSVEGPEFAPMTVHDRPPSNARRWREGEVLVTQGDAYLHMARTGHVTDSVPPATLDHR